MSGQGVVVLAVVDDDEGLLIGEEIFLDLEEVALAPLGLGETCLACCESCFESGAAGADIAAAECGAGHAIEVAGLWIR